MQGQSIVEYWIRYYLYRETSDNGLSVIGTQYPLDLQRLIFEVPGFPIVLVHFAQYHLHIGHALQVLCNHHTALQVQ